jgi:hypothetical protein
MAQRTSQYRFVYLQYGDKWYPGHDYENMLTVENQFEYLYKFIGPSVGLGWTADLLSNYRSDQLSLLSGYINNPLGEYGKYMTSMNLNFNSSVICSAGTTSNVTLTGGAPNSVDGVSLLVNDKILVKNQTNKIQNGIYNVSTLGTGSNGSWTRSAILDTAGDFNSNFLTYVSSGSANTSTLWLATSLGSSFGSTDLYFINAFEQCIKVFPGSGIVDVFSAKTEKPFYFRFQNVNEYHVWAEPSSSLNFNNVCKISAPNTPNINYDTNHKATYLLTAKSSLGSTYYDAPKISEIIYGYKRKNLIDETEEFQDSLNKAYLNHKHLGSNSNPSKIDLNSDLILFGSSTYDGITRSSNSIFIITYSDGTLFSGNFDNYGVPEVYINNLKLSNSDYRFELDIAPCKLVLKNSVLENSVIRIILPLYLQKELLAIDSNGVIAGSAITSSGYVYLTDGVLEDRNPNDNMASLVYRNFSWSLSKYQPPKLFISGNEINPKYYTINNDSALLYFYNTLPSISSYTYDQVKIKLSSVGKETIKNLDSSNTQDLNASSFNSGTLSNDRISNLSHNFYMRYKKNCIFTPKKHLIVGNGSTFFYPENTLSDLQFNIATYAIHSSANFGSTNILLGTQRGLMTAGSTLSPARLSSSFNNDLGRPKNFQDNILHPDGINYFKETYMSTLQGKLFYTNDDGLSWIEVKLPYTTAEVQAIVYNFDISTERVQETDTSYYYKSNLYITTDNGLYYAQIREGYTQDNWDWNMITRFVINDTINYSIDNLTASVEIVTKNTEIIPGDNDLITYDRNLYVGSNSDSYPGLYVGNASGLEQIFSEPVNGIFWIQEGKVNTNKNNLIWWGDYDVYHTHSAKLVTNETGSYWIPPFTDTNALFSPVNYATTANITLSGTPLIDGQFTADGDTVLVKEQDNSEENGIYIINSGSWTRRSDFDTSADYETEKRVEVQNGIVNGGSSWFLVPVDSFVLNTDPVVWDIYKTTLYSTFQYEYATARPKIQNVVMRNNDNNEYFIVTTDSVILVNDSGPRPTITEFPWDTPYQGTLYNVLSVKTADANGLLYAVSDRGLFVSTSYLWSDKNSITQTLNNTDHWKRIDQFFLDTDTLKLFDVITGAENNNFDTISQYQIIKFDSAVEKGTNYFYERSFTDFYTDPWEQSFIDVNGNSFENRVVVYINNEPAKIPYITDPALGLIKFTSSIDPQYLSNVQISISANDMYLTNIGQRTHEEIFMGVSKSEPIAVLSVENGILSESIYLNQAVDSTLKILLLENDNNREIVYVKSVDNAAVPVRVDLYYSRSNSASTTTFPIGTSVYSVIDSLSSSIENDLYEILSKETYNLASNNNENTNQLILSLKNEIPTLFDISPAPIISQTDTRGLKSIKYCNDFKNDSLIDTFNSDINESFGLEYSLNDPLFDINRVTSITNLSTDGQDCLISTEKGIWKYTGGRWKNITINEISNFNFVRKLADGTYLAGSENGLYSGSASFEFTKDNLYVQNIVDFEEGLWGTEYYRVYAKSDGLLFIKSPDATSFTSAYIANLDNVKVSGIFKTSGVKLVGETISSYDILFACADSGIYGISDAVISDVFSSSLTSRKLLDNPKGVGKYFKCFTPFITPTIPVNTNTSNYLFILTDDGILRSDNWKWCNPADTTGASLNIDKRFLQGTQCFSYALDMNESIDGVLPGKSKIFIGTDKGVYRSLDGGITFEPTQRFDKFFPVVYNLEIFESTYLSNSTYVTNNILVACTNIGIWYSSDDGDNWYKTGYATDDNEYPLLIDSNPTNKVVFSESLASDGYLGQTFVTKNTSTLIDKVYAMLEVNAELSSNQYYNNSLSNNTVQAFLCQLDINGKPDLSNVLASSSNTKNPDEIVNGDFSYFNFNYSASSNSSIALVIKETIAANSISVLSWKKSNLVNPFSGGKAYEYRTSTWNVVDLDNDNDFLFKVFYSTENSETQNIIPVGNENGTTIGWDEGKSRGVISNDSGHLTLDLRFLISLVIDDSASMQFSKQNSNYEEKLIDLLTALKNRTVKTVSSVSQEFTAYDLWSADTITNHITKTGFIRDLTSIETYINDFNQDGFDTDVYAAIDVASVGMNPASVNDLFIKSNDETNNITRSEIVRNYLSQNSKLRLNDLVSNYELVTEVDDWDETESNISSSETARKLMLDRFSNTYLPTMICITDGENITYTNVDDLIRNTELYWKNQGYNVLVFGLSGSDFQTSLIHLTKNGGYYFSLENDSDWDNVIDILLHGGNKSLFNGSWSREFYYDVPKYISSVYAEFTYSTGQLYDSECAVEVRYSEDYINFTSWISLSSGVDFLINKKLTNIEYRIIMVEGWTGSAIVTPYVSALYHTEVTPAEKYFISNEISTDGYLNEYILATNEIEYDTAKFEWGIVRGNTTSWNNFESIVVGKNSVLSQRQKTIQNTNEVSYSGLTAINIDSGYLKYQIYNNNEIFKWGTNASVNVFINGALILENLYRYDNNLGIITFDSPLTSQDVVTVDVVLLSSDYISFGENTTTSDYKTYYSENGPWLSDDNVVVYVNNELQRGTYDLDKYSGSVIFRKYLSYLDKVNIFVKLSNSFKIAVKVLDYDTSVSKPINFAITYSTKNNLDKVSEYRNFSLPDIIDNKVNLKSTLNTENNGISIKYPMYVGYTYSSSDNSAENGSNINWFRTRSGITKQINVSNSLPNYDDRTLQRQYHLNETDSVFSVGDEIFVKIEPKNLYKTGLQYTSEIYTLTSRSKPYTVDVKIKSSTTSIINSTIASSNVLTAYYAYTDLDLNTDSSIVTWYDWSSGIKTFINTGNTLATSFVTTGKLISFTVLPYNGTSYGDLVESEIVLVI